MADFGEASHITTTATSTGFYMDQLNGERIELEAQLVDLNPSSMKQLAA